MNNNIIKIDLFVYDSPHFNKEDYHNFLNKLEKQRKAKPVVFEKNELHKIDDYLSGNKPLKHYYTTPQGIIEFEKMMNQNKN
jgi:hypothetical protein